MKLSIFFVFILCRLNAHAFDMSVHVFNSALRSEYKASGEIFSAIYKPQTGFGLGVGMDFKKMLRFELEIDQAKYKIGNTDYSFEKKSFELLNTSFKMLIKIDDSIYTSLGYKNKQYLLTTYDIDSTTQSISPEIEPYAINQYEIGIGIVTRSKSLVAATEINKIHFPEQSVSGLDITGHGTDIEVRLEIKNGIGIKFNYINSILNYESEFIHDERVYGIYQKIIF